MNKTNKTAYAILGMLSIEPMSGYAMRQLIKQSTAYFWSESDGQLYPALAKLNKQGLIQIKKENAGTREKKVYQITAKGKAELKQWLLQEAETHIVRNEAMLKLFFGANITTDITLERMQKQRSQTKTVLNHLIKTQKDLSAKERASSHFPYWDMTLDYGIRLSEAKLRWCDSVIASLKKIKH